MTWSFSAHSSFRKCPRQWFYKRVYASSRSSDSVRREAHRLSKLESLQAWRGKIVDAIISQTVVPSVKWNQPCSLDGAKMQADRLFATGRAERVADNGAARFFEVEYGIPLTEERFTNARAEIHAALENFYKAAPVWTIMRGASALVPQRPVSFKIEEVSVRVVPDLVAFQAGRAPAIFDWKVNAYPMRDYWLQLVTGAIGVTRCNPHRDWPQAGARHEPHEIQLFEVQLLTGDVRTHSITEPDVNDADDFISISASQMQLVFDGRKPKELRPEELPAATEPKTCQTCPFKKPCWELRT